MTLPSDTTLALIKWLASRDSDQLLTLMRHRAIAVSSCGSFRSLAEALVHSQGTTESLSRLSRPELQGLSSPQSAPDEVLDALEAAGFLSREPSGHTLFISPVELEAVGSLDPAARPPRPASPSPLGDKARSIAATHALTMVVTVGDLLEVLRSTSTSVGPEGLPTATALKNLDAALGVGYDISALWRMASLAGLLRPHQGLAALTAAGNRWLEMPEAERWHTIATAWWESLPPWLRTTCAANPTAPWDHNLETQLGYHFPLVALDVTLERVREDAHFLGVLADNQPTPWGIALWGPGEATAILGGDLPAHSPGVFAQEDYTLLATGPLSPQHRRALGTLATRDLGGLIPRFRLTSSSLLGALQRGVPAQTIPEMLAEVCVNDVPAGMLALVSDISRRAHDLEVHSRGETTLVITRGDTLAQELLSDPGLVVLGLTRHGDHELVCSWPAERVHSTLLGASYPALLMNSGGQPENESAPVPEDDPETLESKRLEAVAQLVHNAAEAAAKGVPAGFQSIIEVATETKTPLEIVVTMPDGTEITIVMEPRALSAGRLRGVEIKHAVEKTIPVSHITSIRDWTES